MPWMSTFDLAALLVQGQQAKARASGLLGFVFQGTFMVEVLSFGYTVERHPWVSRVRAGLD